MNVNIREIIFDTLLTLETTDRKSHLLIREVLDKYDWLDARDKAFFKRVSEGTIAHSLTLDYVLDRHLTKPVSGSKPAIRVILRMSAYQLLFMDKVPASAVCDEAVKLCKKKARAELSGFVNGVLRAIAKEGKAALDFSDTEDRIKRLSVTYSLPEHIVRIFDKEEEDAESLLKAINTPRGTCVKLKDPSERERLTRAWEASGLKVRESRLVRDAFVLDGIEGAESICGFAEGSIIVMDEASMLAAETTGIKPGDDLKVIDVCGAPGGKSSYVASIMNPKGRVVTFDISELKVGLIRENFARLDLANAECHVGDATVFNEELKESADVLIADVPCSGLGVMGRKSDLRYRITNEAMKEICDLQKKIINNVWQYVKPGGVMVFSTCTLHRAENEKNVKYILENLPFDLDRQLKLRPDKDGCDGFFVARFIRR